MPDTGIYIFNADGQSAFIDMRTEDTNSQGRQVIVVGDPSVNAAVAEVVSVPPGTAATNYGQVVRVAGSVQIGGYSGSAFLTGIYNSIGVYFDRGNPSVSANYGTGTFLVAFDRANPNVLANYGTGTFIVAFDSSKGFLQGINNSLAVYFDRGNPSVTVSNLENTAIVYRTTQGTTSSAGGSGLNTLVSAEASRNIKVYAFSLTTTAQVHLSAAFADGSSAGGTRFWRVGLQAPSQGIAGANLAVTPPAYLFATGSGVTLALFLDSASLVHYSVGYFKESG